LKSKERVNDGKIINKIYITSKDNRRLFEIGREIDVSDQYIYNKTNHVIKDSEGNEISDKNIFYDNGRILKYIEFVSKYLIYPTNGKSFTKYNIDTIQLNSVLLSNEKTLDDAVGEILKNIFESNSYLFI